jgi:co-chaperonin GroES (HSP10)
MSDIKRTLRAVGQKVIIKPDVDPDVTPSGIVLHVGWQPPASSGTVVSVGRGRYDHKGNFIPTELRPGMRVSYRWIDVEAPQNQFEWHGESLRVINEKDLVGIIEKEEAA